MSKKCCLCGKEMKSFYEENNPWPLAKCEKACCSACNDKVVNARIALATAFHNDEAEAEPYFKALREECRKSRE